MSAWELVWVLLVVGSAEVVLSLMTHIGAPRFGDVQPGHPPASLYN